MKKTVILLITLISLIYAVNTMANIVNEPCKVCPSWQYGLRLIYETCASTQASPPCPCATFDYESSGSFGVLGGYYIGQNVNGVLFHVCDCENINEFVINNSYAIRVTILEPASGVYFTSMNFTNPNNPHTCTLGCDGSAISVADGEQKIYLSSHPHTGADSDYCVTSCTEPPTDYALDYFSVTPGQTLYNPSGFEQDQDCCFPCGSNSVTSIETCSAQFLRAAMPILLIDLPMFTYDFHDISVSIGTSVRVRVSIVEYTEGVTLGRELCSCDILVGTFSIPTLLSDDFNGDNTSDILWSNIYSSDTAVFLMGTAGVTGSLNPGTEAEIDWQVFGPGDFNGDGIADILWTNEATGELKIWFMNSEGFDHTQSVGTADLANYNLYGPADFNGDGCADLLWRHKTSGQMFFWYLDENGYAGSSYLGTVSDLTYQIYGPADFNGDGIADFMWRNNVTGVMFLWYMNSGGFDHSVYMGTLQNPDWVLETFADFNNNGNCDIYLRNHGNGQMAIWHPNDAGQITSQYIGTIPDMNWQIACSGDFSGDGCGDIIWRNVNTGVLFRWTFNDTGYTGSTYLGTVADADWVISNR